MVTLILLPYFTWSFFLILSPFSEGRGPVVGPGAHKPSVGEGKESSRLFVNSDW